MTKYNSLNVKLSNSQLDKLKFAIEDGTEVVLRLSSNMIGDFNDKIKFLHELSLTNRHVANISKAFANKSSTDIKLSKTQISKMIQSGRILCRLLCPLLKTRSPLMENVIKQLAKGVLIPLGVTAAASGADTGIHKIILGSGRTSSSALPNHPSHNNNTILIKSNDEMKDIIRIVKSLEDSGLLMEGVSKTIQNEAKEQKGRFVSMLLGTLDASLLGNILAGKGTDRAGEKGIVKRQGRGIVRAGYGNKNKIVKTK